MTDSNRINPYLILTWAIMILAFLLLLTCTNELTRTRITDNQQEARLKVLRQIIPGQYNNVIFKDTIEVTEPGYLGTDRPVTVFRSRSGESALGAIYFPVIAEGYNGPIQLAIGITHDGIVSGVRVIYEEETDGLGAEVNQQNSDWILVFDRLSYATVPRERWDLSKENGYFDQISGATITSRSVINAVRNTLDYHHLAGDNLYK